MLQVFDDDDAVKGGKTVTGNPIMQVGHVTEFKTPFKIASVKYQINLYCKCGNFRAIFAICRF